MKRSVPMVQRFCLEVEVEKEDELKRKFPLEN